MMVSLKAFWQQRQPRERSMLAWAMVVIAATLIYVLLLAPALSARQRLQTSLPLLRQQSLTLQSLLEQAKNLPAPVAQENSANVPLTKESLETSLKHKGLSAKELLVSGDLAKLQLSDVAFANLLDWLNEVQQSAHWQVVDATLNAQATAGLVNATISFRQQSHE